MAAGTDLNTISAKAQLPASFVPQPRIVSARSPDGVWQAAQVASPLYDVHLNYTGQTVTQKNDAEQHYKDNGAAGIKFPWTNPLTSVTLNFVYDPEEGPPEFTMETTIRWAWTVKLIQVT